MKNTDVLIRLASLFIFVAMIIYLGVYLVNRVIDPVQTALAVTATMTDSSTMSGLVVRDELVLRSDQPYIEVTVSNGEKVGAGQAVATVYQSADDLERASEISTLAQEIEDVSAVLSNATSSSTTVGTDKSIYNAVIDLSQGVRSGDLLGIDTQVNALTSILFRQDSSTATQEYLQQLQARYSALTSAAAWDTITVNESGTFSNVVDGFEGVSPTYVESLTPSALRDLIAADRVIDSSAVGKLITSFDWYYAAILEEEDVERLIEAGSSVKLSFGRYYSGLLSADVVSISQEEDGERLVLFEMNEGLVDMLAVRAVSADLVFDEYSGLRVPLKGLFRYYAGYVSEADGAKLSEGSTVTLTLGGVDYVGVVDEVGSATAYGDLADDVEAGSEKDDRPKRCRVVIYWPWEDVDAPDFSSGGGTITLKSGTELAVTNYYNYDEDIDRMCVFTMTGLQAERKKVELVYAGEEYALVSSEGTDALREGNEIIVQAKGLYDGKVFS